jgi:hypothetical protein
LRRCHIQGAELLGLSFAADTSQVGIERSYGLMAHYRYELGRLDERAARYKECGRPSVASGAIPD